jgi:hypothetical protein
MSDGAQSLDIPMFAELAGKVKADGGTVGRSDGKRVAVL